MLKAPQSDFNFKFLVKAMSMRLCAALILSLKLTSNRLRINYDLNSRSKLMLNQDLSQ
jgi:hypothetical protein